MSTPHVAGWLYYSARIKMNSKRTIEITFWAPDVAAARAYADRVAQEWPRSREVLAVVEIPSN